MTPEQKWANVIADNRLTENAGWDRDLLALELGALAEADLDFELGAPEDDRIPAPEEMAITRPGISGSSGRTACSVAMRGRRRATPA